MKRSATTSLSIVATFLAFSGSGFALGQSQSGQLTSGAALLGHSLDTKRGGCEGQAVTAKLINPIDTAEGLTLPRGTELLGRVAEVQASHGKSAATLTLIFDKARTKDGKEVAIKATLVAIGPQNTLSDTSGTVATTDSFDQPAGELPGVSLHSVVQSDSSGTLTMQEREHPSGQWDVEILIAVAPLDR